MKEKLGLEPAFPPSREMQELSPNCEGYHVGMSKRFYAACAAMQGLISHYGVKYEEGHVRKSFEFADELLRQEQLNQNENETDI